MQAPGRIIINQLPDRVEIIIPAKKNWITLVIFTVIIGFWALTGGLAALMALPDKEEIDYSDWVWALWGIAVILITLRNLLYMIRAKEVIVFNQGTLSVKKQNSIFSRGAKYDLTKARSFRVEDDDDNDSLFDGRPVGVIGSGTICFNYERKTIRFAEAVTQSEADHILRQLQARGILSAKNL